MFFFFFDDDAIEHGESEFESIKHINEYGQEYWSARELMPVLEYRQWRRFSETIERAKISCEASGNKVSDHFADVGKMILNDGDNRLILIAREMESAPIGAWVNM